MPMPNDRSWMMYNMREHGNKEYTESEVALHKEIINNCFGTEIPLKDILRIMRTQFRVKNLQLVEDIKPTNPPPMLDICIPELKVAIRVNGLIHQTRRNRLKDEDQKIVLEGNGWTVIDVDFSDREDLWE